MLRGAERLLQWHARVRPKTFRMFAFQFLAFAMLLFVSGQVILLLLPPSQRQDAWDSWYAIELWASAVFAFFWVPNLKPRGSFRERVREEWQRAQTRRAP